MKKFVKALFIFAQTLFAAPLLAAGSEHGINWWHLGSEYKDSPALGWLTITFLIFVYAVAQAVKKPLSLYLETRSKDIKKQIEEGKIAKEESAKKLKSYEAKLASLSSEIKKMQDAFVEQANAEKALKTLKAKEAAQRIERETEDMIKASFERAKNKLSEEVIAEAMAKAQTIIEGSDKEKIDNSLKSSLITDLKSNAKAVLK